MSWSDKVGSTDNLFLFCKEWTSKKEITEKFGLTSTEAWNACKFLRKMKFYIEVKKGEGITKKKYLFKTRYNTQIVQLKFH